MMIYRYLPVVETLPLFLTFLEDLTFFLTILFVLNRYLAWSETTDINQTG